MLPLQLAAIVALVVGAAIYVWRGVTRDMRTIEQFFRGLVQRLSQVLEPKGFRLTRHVYMRQSFGHRIATFRSEEHTSELQSQSNLVCRLLLEKKKKNKSKRMS